MTHFLCDIWVTMETDIRYAWQRQHTDIPDKWRIPAVIKTPLRKGPQQKQKKFRISVTGYSSNIILNRNSHDGAVLQCFLARENVFWLRVSSMPEAVDWWQDTINQAHCSLHVYGCRPKTIGGGTDPRRRKAHLQ